MHDDLDDLLFTCAKGRHIVQSSIKPRLTLVTVARLKRVLEMIHVYMSVLFLTYAWDLVDGYLALYSPAYIVYPNV